MKIWTLLLLPGVALAVSFYHTSQGTTDITTIVIPSNADWILLNDNNLGVSGIPSNYFQNLPLLYNVWLSTNNLDDGDLPDHCFAGIGASLGILALPYNMLTVIRRNQFSGLAILEALNLQYNLIHTIQTG